MYVVQRCIIGYILEMREMLLFLMYCLDCCEKYMGKIVLNM